MWEEYIETTGRMCIEVGPADVGPADGGVGVLCWVGVTGRCSCLVFVS